MYHLYEMGRLWAPHPNGWNIARKTYSCGKQALSFSEIIEAGYNYLYFLTKDYPPTLFGIESTNIKNEVIIIKEKTIIQDTFCDLKFFSRSSVSGENFGVHEPSVLLVAPLSGHHPTLLKDTVKEMVKDHNVYITHWKDPKNILNSHGPFSLNLYIDYLVNYIKYFNYNVHVMAVCQPSVPVLIAVSFLAEQEKKEPLSMVLMGGPIDTRINPGKINHFAKNYTMEWFKNNMVMPVPSCYEGHNRLVCPGFIMLFNFLALNWDRHTIAFLNFFYALLKKDMEKIQKHESFYNEYFSVMDLPGEYFLDSIEHVFKEHTLPKNKFYFKNTLVNPASVQSCALMTIEGEKDDISPLGQTYAAHNLCENIPPHLKSHYVQISAGHYGIFSGTKWRLKIYPLIKEFIEKVNNKKMG